MVKTKWLREGGVWSRGSQDDEGKERHDGGTDQPGDRHGNEPSDKDVPEETPVHSLLRTQPANCHN